MVDIAWPGDGRVVHSLVMSETEWDLAMGEGRRQRYLTRHDYIYMYVNLAQKNGSFASNTCNVIGNRLYENLEFNRTRL